MADGPVFRKVAFWEEGAQVFPGKSDNLKFSRKSYQQFQPLFLPSLSVVWLDFIDG
jgi:hypothetical protein